MSIVPYYAAALAILCIVLSVRVIRARRSNRVALGTGGVSVLERRVRAHGNFVEYTPLALILLAMAETRGTPAALVHLLCLAFVLGRISHAYGLSREPEDFRYRVGGMICTFNVIALSALAIVVAPLIAG